MLGNYARRIPTSKPFDRRQWESSPEYQALLKKLLGFSEGNLVIVAGGAKGTVISIDKQSLTVRVNFGKLTQGYSVKVVEHDIK